MPVRDMRCRNERAALYRCGSPSRRLRRPRSRQVIPLSLAIILVLEFVSTGEARPGCEKHARVHVRRIDVAVVVAVVRRNRLKARSRWTVRICSIGMHALIANAPIGAGRQG